MHARKGVFSPENGYICLIFAAQEGLHQRVHGAGVVQILRLPWFLQQSNRHHVSPHSIISSHSARRGGQHAPDSGGCVHHTNANLS